MANMTTTKNKELQILVTAALFVALSYIARFVLHFNVLFLTFEIKDAIICIGGLFLGPLYALGISLAVALLELVTISDTGIYGFVMNVLAAATFSGVSALVYKFWKKLWGAVVALMCGAVAMVSVMLLANLFITPYYMGATVDAVKELIPTLLLPFNLIKATTNMGVVLLLYKPTTQVLSRIGLAEKRVSYRMNWVSIVLLICSVLLIAGSIFAFVFVLHGEITW